MRQSSFGISSRNYPAARRFIRNKRKIVCAAELKRIPNFEEPFKDCACIGLTHSGFNGFRKPHGDTWSATACLYRPSHGEGSHQEQAIDVTELAQSKSL
jgi:hypothetical protein